MNHEGNAILDQDTKTIQFDEVDVDGWLSRVILAVTVHETIETHVREDGVTLCEGHIDIVDVRVSSLVSWKDGEEFRRYDADACAAFIPEDIEEIVEACGGIDMVYERVRQQQI